MAPFFSVILPVYNVKEYLQRCVDSVLAQSYRDFEMILVDDGATDGSGALCDQLAENHACIRVLHKENGGLSSARNAGLQVAEGQYIWWVDSDDYITPDALQQLHSALQAQPADMVKFSYIRTQGADRQTVQSNVSAGLYGPGEQEALLQRALLSTSKCILSAWSHVYRRKFLLEQGLTFVSERLVGSEDYLFNLQALLKARQVLVLQAALYYYELRLGSLSQRYKKDLPQRFTALFDRLCAFYRQEAAWQRYGSRLQTFYVWHLMRGTCIPNEYYVTPEHTLKQGRRNIRCYLRSPAFRKAAAGCYRSHMTAKERLQLLALQMGFEPLFYRLYVRKKGKTS